MGSLFAKCRIVHEILKWWKSTELKDLKPIGRLLCSRVLALAALKLDKLGIQ